MSRIIVYKSVKLNCNNNITLKTNIIVKKIQTAKSLVQASSQLFFPNRKGRNLDQ